MGSVRAEEEILLAGSFSKTQGQGGWPRLLQSDRGGGWEPEEENTSLFLERVRVQDKRRH